MNWKENLQLSIDLKDSGKFWDSINVLSEIDKVKPGDFHVLRQLRDTIDEYGKLIDNRLDFHYKSELFISENKTENAKIFKNRWRFLDFCLKSIRKQGLWLEFGVHKGESINFISKYTSGIVHGFDSFEGLPENFGNLPKGFFSLDGNLPKVRSNVKLYQGWFSETIPQFSRDISEEIALIHIDCDLYSSTRDVFLSIGDKINKGTVIILDDFYNSSGWEDLVCRAFLEYLEVANQSVEYIAFDEYRAAVIIK